MLRIYQRLWIVNWAEQWQYRANLMMYLLYWLVSPIVYLAVWTSVASSQGDVNGLTAADLTTYYLTLLIVDQLTADTTLYYLASKIQDGTLSGELLKPIHPILTNVLVNNLAFKLLMLIFMMPVWIVLCLLFRPDFSTVSVLSILQALPMIVLGFFINFLLGSAVTSLAFWTTRVFSIFEFFNAFILLFSGQFVPLSLLPESIQAVARWLPFPLFLYAPIQIILNRMPQAEIWRSYGLGMIWLGIAALLFHFIWTRGLKRFSAVGA